LKAGAAAQQIAAYIAVPYSVGGQWQAYFALADSRPRPWTDAELALVQDVAARIFPRVERARAEAALRASEQRLRLITDATPALIAYVDAELRYRFNNARYHDWFGQVPEELWGRPLREVVGEAAFAGLLPRAEAALAGQRQSFEVEMVFEEIGLRHVQTEFVPDVRPDGSVAGYYSLVVDLTARKLAENALRESEEKYRTLFDSIDEGFALEELVYDANGEIADIIFREVNRSYERQGGLTNVLGKSIREVLPNMEQHWKDVYAQVARTGEPVRLINYAQDVDRWFDTYLTLLAGSSKYVAVVFNDITERKRRELNSALLDEIGKDFAILTAPDELMQAVGQRLSEFLALSGCYFVDVDEAKNEVGVHYGWASGDVPSLMQTFRLEDYLSEDFLRTMRADEVFVLRDTAQDSRADAESYARLKIGSFVTVPFFRQGRYVGHIAVTTERAHAWQPQEIQLLEEVSSRVFPRIERARAEEALAASEQRLRALIANLPGAAAFVVGPDLRYQLAGGEALEAAGLSPADLLGRTVAETMPPELVPQYETHYRQALAGQGFSREHTAHGRTFITRGVPLLGAAGQPEAVLVVSYDITARKQAEEALRTSEA
jgi:PAS domain S-box-containing protein